MTAKETATAKDGGGNGDDGLQMWRQQQKRRNNDGDREGRWVNKNDGGDGAGDGKAARVTQIRRDMEIYRERGIERERKGKRGIDR